ncbi:MAG: 50S ribosomal protein L21e [Candidatus Diapherotrites archaeon]
MACKKAKGKRAKTRQKLRRKKGMKKLTVNKQLSVFDEGEKVQINIDPSVHSGFPNPRYQGFVGTVDGKQGPHTFKVSFKLGRTKKMCLVNGAHLKVLKMQTKAENTKVTA